MSDLEPTLPNDPSIPPAAPPAFLTPLELTPKEFLGLLERLGPDHQERARHTRSGSYEIWLSPIRFYVERHAYERHQLQGLLAKFASGWKDVLTEGTLIKLRALLAAAPPTKRPAAE